MPKDEGFLLPSRPNGMLARLNAPYRDAFCPISPFLRHTVCPISPKSKPNSNESIKNEAQLALHLVMNRGIPVEAIG